MVLRLVSEGPTADAALEPAATHLSAAHAGANLWIGTATLTAVVSLSPPSAARNQRCEQQISGSSTSPRRRAEQLWCRGGELGTSCSGGDAVPTGPLRSGRQQ
jgi:hypothetical protein